MHALKRNIFLSFFSVIDGYECKGLVHRFEYPYYSLNKSGGNRSDNGMLGDVEVGLGGEWCCPLLV